MLRGYRGKHGKAGLIAAAVALALAIGLAIISVGRARDADYQRQADYQSREYAAYTQQQIRQNCFPLADKHKAGCVNEKRHEYRQNRREERDLVAQRKSANWAYIMGAAAVIGMVLSVVGVALVWTTFAETRRANEIASDTAKRQLRAYVNVSDIQLAAEGRDNANNLQASASFVNAGQTPAIDLSAHLWVAVSSGSFLERMPIIEHSISGSPSKAILGAGLQQQITHVTEISGHTAADVLTGDFTVIVHGLIQYRDIFDGLQETRFRHFQNATSRKGGMPIASCPEGNSMS